MIRNMFKSQLKDDEYDLFFLVGFKKNQFYQNLTSQQLVDKDKVLMKEFKSFNDLGKIQKTSQFPEATNHRLRIIGFKLFNDR